MSGIRGAARKNKMKVKARIVFADTGKKVFTNVFVRNDVTRDDIIARIERKYGKELEVLPPPTWDKHYALLVA